MIAALIAAAALGQATPAPVEKVVQAPDKTVFQKKTLVDFRDVVITSCAIAPSSSYVVAAPHAKFPVLVQVRANFNDKLQTSTDNL